MQRPTPSEHTAEPGAPGIDLRRPARRPWHERGVWPVVAVVAIGGVLGACARYAAALLWPTAADGFPWTTLGVNAVGCALIGVLIVAVSDIFTAHPLVRPFLGTGVLGGFTTFSTYTVDVARLLRAGHPATGLAYAAATVTVALVAVTVAAKTTRRVAAALPGRTT